MGIQTVPVIMDGFLTRFAMNSIVATVYKSAMSKILNFKIYSDYSNRNLCNRNYDLAICRCTKVKINCLKSIAF